jgi:hypothetical protein
MGIITYWCKAEGNHEFEKDKIRRYGLNRARIKDTKYIYMTYKNVNCMF